VARFIHQASPRKDGPFVAINCAAPPEQLLESGLFGYERGAFIGAQQAKAGQIELAARGVLFLDEVSEMSPSAQAKFSAVPPGAGVSAPGRHAPPKGERARHCGQQSLLAAGRRAGQEHLEQMATERLFPLSVVGARCID
jgi:hypothetical protein